MRLSRQFQACLFLFYEKISSVQKRKSTKTNKQKQRKVNKKQKKQRFFACIKTSKRVEIGGAFCTLKKINRLEIVLIASFYYTTNVYPYQPTYL